jgi:hypothetical protein
VGKNFIRKYKKKPIVIEALQWQNDFDDVITFCPIAKMVDGSLIIPTLEGDHIVSDGDYIIKGIAGEFYPCKEAIFNMTYEEEKD